MRTLLVCLGGHSYPDAPDLRHEAFARSSERVRQMLVIGKARIIDETDYLDLFDSNAWWPNQLMEIRNWVERERVRPGSGTASDLIIHYVGHGAFRTDADYYLTLNRTDERDPFETSLTLSSLYHVLSRIALQMRVYIVIDACFAAASLRDMQLDDPGSAVTAKVKGILEQQGQDASVTSGIAILCSSDEFSPSSAKGREGVTQFSDGLLSVIEAGDPTAGRCLSMDVIAKLLRTKLRKLYGTAFVVPILHAPETRDGRISSHPLIPNNALGDAEVLLQGLAPDAKASLEARAAEFVTDIGTARLDEIVFQARVDAMSYIGRKEFTQLTQEIRNSDDICEQARVLRAGPAMKAAKSRVLSSLKIAGGVGRHIDALISPFRTVDYLNNRALMELDELKAFTITVAAELDAPKAALLMIIAEIDTIRKNLWDCRGKVLQMAHVALTLQAQLEQRASELEGANAADAMRLRTRAIPIAAQRLAALIGGITEAERKNDVMLVERNANRGVHDVVADLIMQKRSSANLRMAALLREAGASGAVSGRPLSERVRKLLDEVRQEVEDIPDTFPI